MMIIALDPITANNETMHLQVNISTTLNITAEQARRKLTRFFMDEVSMFITPQSPLLVIVNENQIFWRFPLALVMGKQGLLGLVGQVDVSALSGELILNVKLLEEIKTNAQRLVSHTSLPAIS
jgi:hypothetical protein